MPRGVYKHKKQGHRWTPERRARQMATIRAKEAARTNPLAGMSAIFQPLTDVLDKQIERLQKVRDLLR